MTVVSTRSGELRGTDHGSCLAFRGVRYALPPVGAARFRPAVAAPAWDGVLNAIVYGNRAMQADPSGPGALSEDCLFLNVFTPAADDASRPVLIWLHGGGLIAGSGNDFDGQALASSGDVVVVTLNYRLGFLGFLELGSVDTALIGSGSNGFTDQVVALHWVRDHIAAFGGDPHNVTIFGESGGGGCVRALLGAPSADGLFHRAAAFSPGGPVPYSPDFAGALQGQLSVNAEDLVEVLRSLPAEDLVKARTAFGFYPGTLDSIVTRTAQQAISEHGRRGVPVLAGSVRDEGTLLVAAIEATQPDIPMGLDHPLIRQAATIHMQGEDPSPYLEGLRALYPAASERALALEVFGDVFRRQSMEIVEAASAAGVGAWFYRFDIESPFAQGSLGAAHGVEIPFLFNDFDTTPYPVSRQDTSDARLLELAAMWSGALVAFARTGDPNAEGLPPWPAYQLDTRPCLIFSRDPHVLADPTPDAAHRALWQPTPESEQEHVA